jgi:polyvinyl alcohol dehydrogenase (cytochrome)
MADIAEWMGYGGNLDGSGFQASERAGLTAAEVPDLELLRAFAFPDSTEVRTKPTVVGDVLVVGDQFGGVYAIESKTGCVRWRFDADAGIRGENPVKAGKNGAGTQLYGPSGVMLHSGR